MTQQKEIQSRVWLWRIFERLKQFFKGLHNPPDRIAGDLCANGGFEDGNFNNWVGRYGGYRPFFLGQYYYLAINQQGFPSDRFSLVQSGSFDPNVGGNIIPVTPTSGGQYALRLGGVGSRIAAQARYSFTITSTNAQLRWRYAIVLFDPGHSPSDQPHFAMKVSVSGRGTRFDLKVRADRNDPYFEVSPSNNQVVYRHWECQHLDLSSFIGRQATLEFTTVNCRNGDEDHFALAYIDGICAEPADVAPTSSFTIGSIFCSSGPITADGSGSSNETRHFWSIVPCSSSGTPTGQEIMKWFVGLAGPIDLHDFYVQGGATWNCNQHYRVKLAVGNDCQPWVESSQIIFIRPCPVANAGPDINWCVAPPFPLSTIGTPAIPGYTYSWHPANTLSNPNIAQPSVTGYQHTNTTTIYTLTVTDANGCQARDTVRVRAHFPLEIVGILSEPLPPCGGTRLTVQLGALPPAYLGYSILWSTGATTTSIVVSPSTPTNYSVTVSNPCWTDSATILVHPGRFQGSFPTVFCPNAMSLAPGGSNIWIAVAQVDANTDPGNVYLSYRFRLEIFGRGGAVIFVQEMTSYTGFAQNTIQWDGRINRGLQGPGIQYAPEGVYVFKLWLWNCAQPEHLIRHGDITLIR